MRYNYNDLLKKLNNIKTKMSKIRKINTVLVNTDKTKQYEIWHIYDFSKTPKIIKNLFMNAVLTSQLKVCKKAMVLDPKTQYLCFSDENTVSVEEITDLDDTNYNLRMEDPRFFSGVTDYLINPDTMTTKQKIAMKGLILPLRSVRAGLNKIYKLNYKVYKYRVGGCNRKKTLFEKN